MRPLSLLLGSLAALVPAAAVLAEAGLARQLVAEGRAALERKDPRTATQKARLAMDADDDVSAAVLLLGEAELALGSFEAAYAHFGQVLEQSKDPALLDRARELHRRAGRQHAAGLETRLRSLRPGDDEFEYHSAVRQLAQVLVALGDAPAALPLLNRAVAAPGGAVLLVIRAEVHHVLKRDDLAIADCRKAIELDVERVAAGMALVAYATALGDDRRLVEECLFTVSRGADGLFERARAYERLGQTERAIADYRQLRAQSRDNPHFTEQLNRLESRSGLRLEAEADAILSGARERLQGGDLPSAEERVRTALALRPEHLPSKRLLGQILHRRHPGDDRGLRVLSEVREIAGDGDAELVAEVRRVAGELADRLAADLQADPPSSPDAWWDRLSTLLALQVEAGRLDAALATAGSMGQRVSPHTGHVETARIHELRGEYREAVAEYHAALEDYGSLTLERTWRMLRALRMARNDYPGLIADCSRVLARDPHDLLLRLWRSEALAETGEFAAAVKDLDYLVGRNLFDFDLRLRRYRLRRQAGDFDGMAQDCEFLFLWEAPGYVDAAFDLAEEGGPRKALPGLITRFMPRRGDFDGRRSTAVFLAAAGWEVRDLPLARFGIDKAAEMGVRHPRLAYLEAQMAATQGRPLLAGAALAEARHRGGGSIDLEWLQRIASQLAGAEMVDVSGSRQRIAFLTDLADANPGDPVLAKALARSREKGRALEEEWVRRQAEAAEEKAREQALREHLQPGLAAEKRGDSATALGHYAGLLKVLPTHARAAFHAAVLLLREGRGGEAGEVLQTALAQQLLERLERARTSHYTPILVAAEAPARRLARWTGQKALGLAPAMAEVAGFFTDASEEQIALELLPDYVAEIGEQADFLIARADASAAQFTRAGSEAAARDYARAVILRPADASLRASYARTLVFTGDRAGSFREWDTAIRLEPRNGELFAGRAEALIRADRTEEAIAGLEAFARQDRSVPVLVLLCRHQFDHGSKYEAWKLSKEIAQLDPTASTPAFPETGVRMLELLEAKIREGVERGRQEHQERIEAQQRAREAELEKRRQAEAEAERQAAANRPRHTWVDRFAQDVRMLSAAVDASQAQREQSMREWSEHWRAGSRIQGRLDADSRYNAHLREVERRFGAASRAREESYRPK